MPATRIVLGAALTLLAATLVGIGMAAKVRGRARTVRATADRHRVHPETPSPKRGKCLKGRMTLGDRSDSIRYIVTCKGGPPVERVGFVVTRAILPYAGRHSGIVHVSPAPQLTGSGAVHHFGRCQIIRGQVACHGLADGRVRLSGRLSVRSTPCRWRFGITATVPPADEREGWTGALRIKRLFYGRPTGCS